MKCKEIVGIILASNELSFHATPLQFEGAMKIQPPHVQATVEFFDVAYEECEGKKFTYRMTAPALDYRVTYVLRVPGGYLHITLWTETGKAFDEQLIESKFHTLRLVPST